MVWLNTFFIFKEHAYVANWLSYERCSRPLNETFIWYSWVIRSYIHLCGLEISIKASRRYHGNHQEKSMSIDEAPCEAFSVPVASLKDSHDNYNINTQNDIIYQYLPLLWHALYYITISYERTCTMCMSSSTTDIAVYYGAYVWIFIDEVFSDVCWETPETVRSNFL